ncbi:hypothetical protein JCM8202_001604 [Rhodotorula sphaerocarpa]
MHASFALAALASAALAQAKVFQPMTINTLAAAQANGIYGYGRFPCTQINGDGTFSADQSQCNGLTAPPNPGFGQGSTPAPVNSVCTIEAATGGYYCGIAGAQCTDDSNCDNGVCTGGICQGGFNQGCATDSNCSGFLYCSGIDPSNLIGSCGAVDTYCQDSAATFGILPPSGNPTYAELKQFSQVTSQFCATGYCALTGACAEFNTLVGSSCAGAQFSCGTTIEGQQLVASDPNGGDSCTCILASAPSQRARSRRANVHRRNVCPASHTACTVAGTQGFECIDTSSNIEQCGACASEGGVDCTQIEGAEAVGCVAGTCEIWSCADGYSFDADKAACVAL